MTNYTITRNGAPDIRFTGDLIGHASSKRNSASRWTELDVYMTDTDKVVLVESGISAYEDETPRYRVEVFPAVAPSTWYIQTRHIIEFFGHGWLAKTLYSDMDIDDVEEV